MIPQILLFFLFVLFGPVLPGTFTAILLFGRSAPGLPREALCAVSLLSGFMFQTALWGALRWAGAGYGAVVAAHCAASAVLGVLALRGSDGRSAFMGAMRSFFSAEAAVFLVLSVLLAAFFTYDSVPLYYGDELLRMSMAWSARNGIPAQNIFVWTGVLKYYYVAEFFAGSASAVTGVPLETVYFRFFLPLNWTLLFFGIRGVLAQYEQGFRRYVPHAAFLLFFVSHVNMLTHFTFRQNTFAVGLAALAVSAAWTCLSAGGGMPMLVCAAAPALVTLVKAPCGALLLVFFCAFVLLAAVRGRMGWAGAAAAAGFSLVLWYLAYRSFCGGGFRDAGSLLGVGAVMGSMPEFLPEYITSPVLLAALPDMFGAAGTLMAGGLVTAENLLSALVIGAVPVAAGALWYRTLSARDGGALSGPAGITLASAAAAVAAGTFLYCFVHYRIASGSDRYWLYFSFWLLSAAAYPAVLEDALPGLSVRRAVLLAAVPAAEFSASVADKLPAGPLLAAMAAGLPAWALAVPVCAAAAACALAFRRWPGRAAFAWTVLLSGAAVSMLLRYRLIGLGREDALFLPLWLLAASAWPLLSLGSAPAGGRRPLLTLALVPLLVALAHAPKYSFWASELKSFDGEDWTSDAGLACAALNSSADEGSVYIHNRLDRRVSALAAMCRRRMYASPWMDAVWGDGAVYSEALSDASDFFAGRVADPCRWLRSRGIGYVLWDAAGAGPGFPGNAGRMGFLDTMYRGERAALYSVGPCRAADTGRPGRRI